MSIRKWIYAPLLALVCLPWFSQVYAGQVDILEAKVIPSGDAWRFTVTVEHGDTGWNHYADAWRVVTEKGEILGERILMHPHEGEQPFTRSLDGVKIPQGTAVVYIEAHDLVHGWASKRYKLPLK